MVVCEAYTTSKKNVWDDFVSACKTPLFFFKREFMEYHSDRFKDASLMFYEDEILVALFPASIHGGTLVSHGGLTYGGVLLSPKVRAETVLSIFDELLVFSKKEAYEKIIYKPVPHIFSLQAAQEDLYALHRLGAQIVRRDFSSIIYLSNRPKLSKGRRWLVARAKKVGLVVSESVAWGSFHELLSDVLVKHGASPVHSPEELAMLAALFPENIVLKAVEYEGVLIAAALLFKFENTVHTQYLATNEQGKELGALDYLIEDCILERLSEQYQYFSFGISTENHGTVLNFGLLGQKESFGARGMAIDFY